MQTNFEKPDIREQIDYVAKLRETSPDGEMLKAIEENLIAIRNLEYVLRPPSPSPSPSPSPFTEEEADIVINLQDDKYKPRLDIFSNTWIAKDVSKVKPVEYVKEAIYVGYQKDKPSDWIPLWILDLLDKIKKTRSKANEKATYSES